MMYYFYMIVDELTKARLVSPGEKTIVHKELVEELVGLRVAYSS